MKRSCNNLLFIHLKNLYLKMNKKYISPKSAAYSYEIESSILLSSPGLKNEVGGDEQLSNSQSGWDNPEWVSDEE